MPAVDIVGSEDGETLARLTQLRPLPAHSGTWSGCIHLFSCCATGEVAG